MNISLNKSESSSKLIPQASLWALTYSTIGLLIFPFIYTLEGVFRPGYSPLAQTISSLSFGSTEWVQRLNFMLLGLVMIWVATIWHQLLSKAWAATWYAVIKAIEGFGLIALAIFPVDPWHTISMLIVMIAMSLSLFVLALYFWRNTELKGLAVFSLLCGLWPCVIMPFFGISLDTHGLFYGYAGLLERIGTNADTFWAIVILIYFWKRRSVRI